MTSTWHPRRLDLERSRLLSCCGSGWTTDRGTAVTSEDARCADCAILSSRRPWRRLVEADRRSLKDCCTTSLVFRSRRATRPRYIVSMGRSCLGSSERHRRMCKRAASAWLQPSLMFTMQLPRDCALPHRARTMCSRREILAVSFTAFVLPTQPAFRTSFTSFGWLDTSASACLLTGSWTEPIVLGMTPHGAQLAIATTTCLGSMHARCSMTGS